MRTPPPSTRQAAALRPSPRQTTVRTATPPTLRPSPSPRQTTVRTAAPPLQTYIRRRPPKQNLLCIPVSDSSNIHDDSRNDRSNGFPDQSEQEKVIDLEENKEELERTIQRERLPRLPKLELTFPGFQTPKQPKTPYMYWKKAVKDQTTENLLWRDLPENEKQVYIDQHVADCKRYSDDVRAFNDNLRVMLEDHASMSAKMKEYEDNSVIIQVADAIGDTTIDEDDYITFLNECQADPLLARTFISLNPRLRDAFLLDRIQNIAGR